MMTEIKDALGRVLVLRELEVLEEADIVRLCGDASVNPGYMSGYVFPSVAVASIDGDPVPVPVTERELRFTIKRVGRDGIAAVHAEMIRAAKEAQGAISKEAQEVKN